MTTDCDRDEATNDTGPDQYGHALRAVAALLRSDDRTTGERRDASSGRSAETDLVTAMNLIAGVLERPIANGKRHLVGTRAAALLALVLRKHGNRQPDVLAPEPVRAGFTRALRAIRDGHPKGPAALLVAGLAFKNHRAAIAFAESLLGTNDGARKLATEIVNVLPGRDAIIYNASALSPKPDERLDALRLTAVRLMARSVHAPSRTGVELHRLTNLRTLLEAAQGAVNTIGPVGLDGSADAIIDEWQRTWKHAPSDNTSRARELLPTCRARTGRPTQRWNGALDELDDETLVVTVCRFAGRARTRQR